MFPWLRHYYEYNLLDMMKNNIKIFHGKATINWNFKRNIIDSLVVKLRKEINMVDTVSQKLSLTVRANYLPFGD